MAAQEAQNMRPGSWQTPARARELQLVQTRVAPGPRHVAIIMDGNHRWARRRGLPGAAGHRAGARNVRAVAESCADACVEYLTLFAFSTENWQRPRPEVKVLLDLMRGVLSDDLEALNERGARLRFIGDRGRFPEDLQRLMQNAEERTLANDRLHLTIAANYGGRWDVVQAARQLAGRVRDGDLGADDIDEAAFGACLSLGGLPPPDLCIRTGGDQRISNFLLWDFAYTEFHFTSDYWPEFDAARLAAVFEDFGARQRRLGRRP